MALYEYKGQQYDIETDDPVLAKNKILKYLETGEGESKPKSAQQAPVEGAGGYTDQGPFWQGGVRSGGNAAFGVYRPQGRRPENQNRNREENKDMALQTARGVVSNVAMPLGLPVDIANAAYNLPRTAQDISNRFQSVRSQLAGNERQPLPELPPRETIPGIGDYGMNFYNQFIPGPDPENAAQQLAFAGGQALGAPIGAKAVSGAIAAPRVIRGGVNQVRTGGMEGVNNPVQRPGPNTAFAELTDQVYPNTTVKPYMKLTPEQQVQGLPALEASRQPSNSLFSGFLDKAALRLAPEGPTGGKLVPLEGKGLQAFTEQTTRDFFNKPKSFNDVLSGKYGNIGGALAGLAVTAGNPLGAAAGFFAPQYVKALEILGQRRLQNKAALQPDFQQQLGQAQQTAGRIGLEGSLPQTPLLGYTPRQGGGGAAGPVPPTMYVNPAGEATTNLAGTQVNMNPGSLAAPTAAANAAMATTQRVSSGQPRTPRAQEPFTMPTAQETFDAAKAARPSHQIYEAVADAVAQRTKDILKQARIEGRNLSPKAAADIADDEIRAVRFQKKNEAAGPKLAEEGETPALVKTPGEGTLDKPNVEFDRSDWFKLQAKSKLGVPLTAGEQSLADKITGRYGPDPFGSGDLTGNKMFNTVAQGETTPVAAVAPTAEMPVIPAPTTKTITPEQQAKRDDFINNRVPKRVEGMKQGRASNKEEYADKAEIMREMAADNKARGKKDFPMYGRYSEGQNMNPKDVFTERKAVADMVNQVSQGNVTSKNKSIIVKRQGYNQMADDIGITLDWDTAPRAGQTIKETRKIMDKWMMDTINKELPELGLYKRRESFTQQQKRLEKEFAAEEAALTPEQRAARDKQIAAEEAANPVKIRTMDNNPTLKKLLNKGENPKPSSLQAAADKAKANKGNPPPGVMEMKTGGNSLSSNDIFLANIKQNYNHLPEGSFVENGIRHEIVRNSAYDNMPADIRARLVEPDVIPKIYRQVDVATGKVLKGQKSMAELQAEAEQMLKQSREGKKKQGK